MTNMLHVNNIKNNENLWRKVYKVRKDFLKETMQMYEEQSQNIKCYNYNTGIDKYSMRTLTQRLAAELNITCTECDSKPTLFANLTRETAKTGFDIYEFLKLCPNRVLNSPWLRFFQELFQLSTVKDMLVTLNRLLKKAEAKDDPIYYAIARKLLINLESRLSLDPQRFRKLKTTLGTT